MLAQHAAERSATDVHREMARGLYGLATVAATAPFVGILGNLLGIFDAFKGTTGDRTSIMAAIAGCMSDAMWPTGLGLAVAILALTGYQYFRARLAEMDAEMEIAVLQLPVWLKAM